MLQKIIITAGFACLAAGCSTISEEACIEGSWESLGYEDGRNGKSQETFTKISETCTKYGVSANSNDYFSGYDKGLPLYCTYDRGHQHGEGGRAIKEECRLINALPYLDGYDEGQIIYEIRVEYNRFKTAYDEVRLEIEDIALRLTDETTTSKTRSRLKRKLRVLENELDDIRFEIRSVERNQGWSKFKLTRPNYNGYTN